MEPGPSPWSPTAGLALPWDVVFTSTLAQAPAFEAARDPAQAPGARVPPVPWITSSAFSPGDTAGLLKAGKGVYGDHLEMHTVQFSETQEPAQLRVLLRDSQVIPGPMCVSRGAERPLLAGRPLLAVCSELRSSGRLSVRLSCGAC